MMDSCNCRSAIPSVVCTSLAQEVDTSGSVPRLKNSAIGGNGVMEQQRSSLSFCISLTRNRPWKAADKVTSVKRKAQ
jgi:hypothetical protein